MKRIAITIVYESMHHLEHNDFAQFMLDNFDYWVVVEGLTGNGGSTGWCNDLDLPPNSTDGTYEYLKSLMDRPGFVLIHQPGKKWDSKDEMVAAATDHINEVFPHDRAFLWQVDSDEQWTIEDIRAAETTLERSSHRVAAFQFHHHVREYIATGKWGSGFVKRLWKWKRGMTFAKHEPPTMVGEGAKVMFLPQKFHHFSYTFEKDIAFKEKYYRGYDGLLENWKNMPENARVVPIFKLFPRSNPIGRSASKLVRHAQ